MKNSGLVLMIFLWCFSLSAQDDILNRSELDPDLAPFYHGVASGDPLQDRVIIWTRVTPASVVDSIEVQWRMARDSSFTSLVASGSVFTKEEKDYTVKVDVTGLEPNTWYYYEFTAFDANSLTGRTKTTPDGDISQLRFATVSCSNYPVGYFNVYDRIADRNDIDAVLHLGDYIYEGGGAADGYRDILPEYEILNLADYRLRYSSYRLDSMLRRVHQQYPFITTWDDHESANNAWRGGAENHTPETEGLWSDRKSASAQAYDEWLPIRLPEPGVPGKIFRKISYGNLADIFVLDTRIYDRDLQLSDVDNPSRHILGPEQLDWLKNALSSSTAKWKIIAQQVMIAPLTPFGLTFNTDQWDGYTADRKRLYDHILNNNIQNIIVLTGDIHTAWANDLPYDPGTYRPNTGAGSVAVEFVCTSVTSSSSPILIPSWAYDIIKAILPYIKFSELYKKGYSLLDLQSEKASNAFYFVNSIAEPDPQEEFSEEWCVNAGERRLKKCTEVLSNMPEQYQAPHDPRPNVSTGIKNQVNNFEIVGAYPNPFLNTIMLQFNLFSSASIQIRLYDISGREVYLGDLGLQAKGLHMQTIKLPVLPSGNYELSIIANGEQYTKKLVRM